MVEVRLALLQVPDASEGAVDLVLGVLADRTGVVEDRVGLARCRRSARTRLAELADDELAVEHVHLAADGLDVQLLLCRVSVPTWSTGLPVAGRSG